MRPLHATIAIALFALASGCAKTPITVTPSSVPLLPPSSTAPVSVHAETLAESAPHSETGAGAGCAIRLADVRDIRPNPNELGMMIGRAVRASDSVAWLRSALESLKRDGRLRFVDVDSDARFVLRVELVKAYILVQNTQKSSNVVLRAVYRRGDKDFDTQIARGSDVGANWVNGDEEAQSSLNRALAAAVAVLSHDIVAHCSAPV